MLLLSSMELPSSAAWIFRYTTLMWLYMNSFESDGSPLGLYYGDFYTRESKRGGAWMSELVTPSKLFDRNL